MDVIKLCTFALLAVSAISWIIVKVGQYMASLPEETGKK